MNATGDTGVDLVTGAFSYTGSHIARRLLEAGREVRTFTYHEDRLHPLQGRVDVRRYRFDDPGALARDLEGVTTLYNTYWVRFERGRPAFDHAVTNSRLLFEAAARAGVERIVHISVSNASLNSPLGYYRGKARVEQALRETGVPSGIVRPTWVVGGKYEVLANNIAWLLRRLPVFAMPGDGSYRVQPVHIDDVSRICVESARPGPDRLLDAAGPETLTFEAAVRAIRDAVRSRAAIVHLPPRAIYAMSRVLGVFLRDVVLTPEEIGGLAADLLVSREPPLGRMGFSDWLEADGARLGRSYANEMKRHFT